MRSCAAFRRGAAPPPIPRARCRRICRRRRAAAPSSSAPARPPAAMAQAVEDHWRGPLSGLVVTRYGHGRRLPAHRGGRSRAIRCPTPPGSAAARAHPRQRAAGSTADDLVLCLDLGRRLGAAGAAGARHHARRQAARSRARCCASGATIGEINCVRKHLSAIKGGRLAAAAAPAQVVTLAISDVPGDDPAVIGSGPTVRRSDDLRRCARASSPNTRIDAAARGRARISPPRATRRRSPAIRASRAATSC